MNKRKRELLALAERYDCDLTKTGKRNVHYCFTNRTNGRKAFFSCSPSDRRAILNLKTKLRKLRRLK